MSPNSNLDSAISPDLVVRSLSSGLTFLGCRAQALGLILRIQSLSSMLNFLGSELKL